MSTQTAPHRPPTRDNVSSAPPLRLGQDSASNDASLPDDMGTHVTTTPRRILAIVTFIALVFIQFSLYVDVLYPVSTGEAAFAFDDTGPRIEDPSARTYPSTMISIGHVDAPDPK